jgi:uncharacterized protein (DUF1778 family)
MTIEEIDAKSAREQIKFRVAKQIRQILDDAAKEYGDDWDIDDVESTICEFAFDEPPMTGTLL